jgi:hypothetical protein
VSQCPADSKNPVALEGGVPQPTEAVVGAEAPEE